MKKFYFASLLIPTVLLAAGEGETDIVERTINFVIYIAILYYLAADKIKAIFVARQESLRSLARFKKNLKNLSTQKNRLKKGLRNQGVERKRLSSLRAKRHCCSLKK